MNKDEIKILKTFKKSQGIKKLGDGDFYSLCFTFEIPNCDWEVISYGRYDGYISHLYYNDMHYYSFALDPSIDIDYVLIFEVRHEMSHEQLTKTLNNYYEFLDLLNSKPFVKKTCFKCGKSFTFLDIKQEKDIIYWKSFKQAINYWKDSYCGCK